MSSASSPYRSLDVLTGDQYRQFVQEQVALYNTDGTKGLNPTFSGRPGDGQHGLGQAGDAAPA